MANGGVEHFVMNFYRNIDRSEVQFDFLTSVESDGYFDEEIRALGGKLYRAYPLKKNPIRNYFDIAHIVQKNHYDIVHRHTGSAFGYFDLRAARHGGAKHLILHSHNPQAGKPILHSVFDMFLKFDCIKFACSREAGEFLFGTGAEFEVMNNAIDCDKFEFDSAIRAQVREELGIADSFVMGHIGRFEMQKNHEKLLEIFYEILQKRPNSCLVCVGVGSLMDNRKEQAKRMGIYDKVRFLGSRNDVKRIIQEEGAERVSADAVDALVAYLEADADAVAKKAIKYAKVANRQTVKAEDIALAAGVATTSEAPAKNEHNLFDVVKKAIEGAEKGQGFEEIIKSFIKFNKK